ncbi:uncharacterized protein PHALS_06757 [Plasmopara halstedii]|uniref:Uncharacterized protein n=1 Tax=Plasmopara halstedii TaxID=4781 RepID=A0A0P1B5E2_PLAHL|nr:uncharacterized protein PHALS_06757 [Plasmopara halstedii]CEG48967.1 hypothetical protein PHALS_06757 [Plasmopara halstedii]|eukprot:XP_024585336.1 hypothetical protein PHALS_06757 [Plasmopara halstedii]
MKRLLRQLQATLRASTALVNTARQALDTTAIRYKLYQDRESQHVFEQALREYHDCVARTSMYNQDTAFDFQAQHMEKSNRFFFRPVDPSVHRVSIGEVQLPDGSLSSSQQDITLQLLDHWAFYQVAPTIFGECLCIVFNHHLQVGSIDRLH